MNRTFVSSVALAAVLAGVACPLAAEERAAHGGREVRTAPAPMHFDDRYHHDRQRWAMSQAGAQADAAVLGRGLSACMDARGYTLR